MTENLESSSSDWRDLLDRTSKERDPKRLIQLVAELSRRLEHQTAERNNPYLRRVYHEHIGGLMNAAIAATGADFGTAQLLDISQNSLHLVAQHGFGKDFVNHFQTVQQDDACACGAALSAQTRIFVEDVAIDSRFLTPLEKWSCALKFIPSPPRP